MTLKAVLFDMDGVLLDTEPLYTLAYDRILEQWDCKLDPETKLEIMGRRSQDSAAWVIEKFSLPISPADFLKERAKLLPEIF